MRNVSTKEAARRFYRLLKDAEEGPIVIERHGRPRAAILSARDLETFRRVLGRNSSDISTILIEGAIEKIADGHFNKSVNLKNAALLLAGITR